MTRQARAGIQKLPQRSELLICRRFKQAKNNECHFCNKIMITYATEQEEFWAGEFGGDYAARNRGQKLLSSNLAFFSQALRKAEGLTSILELGANIGLNIIALRSLFPEAKISANEINQEAVKELWKIPDLTVYPGSLFELARDAPRDLVFTKGVLIHVDPELLPSAYDVLHRSSSRYILVAEYYSPSPVEVSYRGHERRLFKRDFGGEILDRHKDLRLRDYGFVYRRDTFPQDDLTWFLLEKE